MNVYFLSFTKVLFFLFFHLGPARDFMRTLAKAVKNNNLTALKNPGDIPAELAVFLTGESHPESEVNGTSGDTDEHPSPSFSDFAEKIVNLPIEDGTNYLLHLAAGSTDAVAADTIMALLEMGADPCVKDGRGRVPYMVATEKGNRNAFRRFMGQCPDR